MKLVFCGPTLPLLASGEGRKAHPELVLAPPARQGDLLRAVRDGARCIGLVDGLFEHVPAVWHKEILFALSKGVAVFGAASMGALRAAECEAFGMVPVGSIARDYASGRRVDDSDVAQLHGPAELGYPALSVPLVTVEAVLDEALRTGVVNASEHAALDAAARAIFFKHRRWPDILARANLAGRPHLTREIREIAARINPKRDDALALIRVLEDHTHAYPAPQTQNWSLNRSLQLETTLEKLCYK